MIAPGVERDCGAFPERRSDLEGAGLRRGFMKNESSVAATPSVSGRHSASANTFRTASSHPVAWRMTIKANGIAGRIASTVVMSRFSHPSCSKARLNSPSSLAKPTTAQNSRARATEMRKSDSKEAESMPKKEGATANTAPAKAIASTTPKLLMSLSGAGLTVSCDRRIRSRPLGCLFLPISTSLRPGYFSAAYQVGERRAVTR